jgi:GNAT superfamily N-acetyltransferase
MVQIEEIPPDQLSAYANIPISFVVSTYFKVELLDKGLGGILLTELSLEAPYVKDYDSTPDGGPLNWAVHFDVQNWGFFLAISDRVPIAGAAIAFNTNGVNLLEERNDLSVPWDIRVRPENRGRGIGKALFQSVANWSRNRGCNQMKIETQNINVPACRFYHQMGCNLGAIHRYAYTREPQISHEVMLNWFLELN